MRRKKPAFRPDLTVPVELWGTIIGAGDKLTWLARVDAAITAGVVPRSFLHVAVRIATQWLNKESGLTWRSAENLASDIGMVKSSVEDLLKDAVAAGLLIMVKPGQRGRGNRSAIYRPAMPEIPDGPGFKQDALIPGGPGFKPSRKFRRKSRFEQPANPGFGPNQIPVGRDDLPEEVIPEDIIPEERGAHAHAAQSPLVDKANVTEAKTTSVDAPLNPAKSNSGDAPIPVTDGPVARTADAALQQPLAEPEQPPPRINPPIGTPANGANADADDRFRMEFERLAREYPRVADKAAALRAFEVAVRARGVTRVRIEIAAMMQERDSDVSDFADALLIIARDLAITPNKPAERISDE